MKGWYWWLLRREKMALNMAAGGAEDTNLRFFFEKYLLNICIIQKKVVLLQPK